MQENETHLPTLPMQSKNEFWQKQLKSLPNISRTEFPVLVLGPSGSGKELIAHKIHQLSPRKNGPFLSINCSALTESLVESELFGHTKGSYTGAQIERKGAFESARGGTLFLDEIGDLPLNIQAKLLRALENFEIKPVGSDKTIQTNVRIIAATHQNLSEKIQDKLFRQDLFYRLNVITLNPPRLRDRMEDFDEILQHYETKYKCHFTDIARAQLKTHQWHGNIRELKNMVARASAIYPHREIDLHELEQIMNHVDLILNSIGVERHDTENKPISVVKDIEKDIIIKKLKKNLGNQRKTARDLGLAKSTLHDRIKYYNIDMSLIRSGIAKSKQADLTLI